MADFWHVTLPNIKWALLYGLILTNARAMGEFGAVSVVSGHIRGETNTMPLLVEIAYNDYNFTAAFALSSLLAALALITLLIQQVMTKLQERKFAKSEGWQAHPSYQQVRVRPFLLVKISRKNKWYLSQQYDLNH